MVFMKRFLDFSLIIAMAGVTIICSCRKEKTCVGCIDNNKRPIADAGPDQIITFLADSLLLDGSASSDPDGAIKNYLWKEISGSGSFNIVSSSATKTVVKNLAVGTYQFELSVQIIKDCLTQILCS